MGSVTSAPKYCSPKIVKNVVKSEAKYSSQQIADMVQWNFKIICIALFAKYFENEEDKH